MEQDFDVLIEAIVGWFPGKQGRKEGTSYSRPKRKSRAAEGEREKLKEEEKGDGMLQAKKPRKTRRKEKLKEPNRCSGRLSKFGAFLRGGRREGGTHRH